MDSQMSALLLICPNRRALTVLPEWGRRAHGEQGWTRWAEPLLAFALADLSLPFPTPLCLYPFLPLAAGVRLESGAQDGEPVLGEPWAGSVWPRRAPHDLVVWFGFLSPAEEAAGVQLSQHPPVPHSKR